VNRTCSSTSTTSSTSGRPSPLPPIIETAVGIAREAGAIHLQFLNRVDAELKGEFDIVTEADRASERLIVERLKAAFPDHSIVGEEGGGQECSSEYRWYVDPLDGTTNFAHGFPMFNVTFGLERAGELIAGVIFDPVRDEMFTAERGSGAFLNDRRIRVSKAKSVSEALVSTGFPSRRRHLNVNVHFYYQLGMLSHGVRRTGSAAIDLAYVACGRLDGFWEFGLKPWDQAAGLVLVTEAGGLVSDMHGSPASVTGPHVMADNALIHDELVGIFDRVFRNDPEFPLVRIGE
jgi:myo-inositol-1(or 4)-monophosphatase